MDIVQDRKTKISKGEDVFAYLLLENIFIVEEKDIYTTLVLNAGNTEA